MCFILKLKIWYPQGLATYGLDRTSSCALYEGILDKFAMQLSIMIEFKC